MVAKRFIADVYLPAHNVRFAKPPEIADSVFVAAEPDQLAENLCVEQSASSVATTPSSSAP
ncbi:hypothetical protein [Mesorhizobium sp. 43Arga]